MAGKLKLDALNQLAMGWTIFLVVIVVAVALALKLSELAPTTKSSTKRPAEEIPYRLRSALFTPAEQLFYVALCQAVSSEITVFGKVRVADVISPVSGYSKSQWQSAFNRISAKHFDYVLCDRNTLVVKAVIELQDKSHQKASRSKRDQFLRKVCADANLRLLEFPAKSRYDIDRIKDALMGI